MNNLMEGTYNEAESHQQFLEALQAWRSAGTQPEEKKEKKVRFNEGQDVTAADPPVKKNFLLDAGGGDFNVNCLPSYEEKEILPDPALQDKKYAQKESCWNCYKLFPVAEGVRHPLLNRSFCS